MDAYELMDRLETALRHIRMAEDELDGTPYAVILHDLTDAVNDINEELLDLQPAIREANRQQQEEQERDYYAAAV
jgi:hypothetical protein